MSTEGDRLLVLLDKLCDDSLECSLADARRFVAEGDNGNISTAFAEAADLIEALAAVAAPLPAEQEPGAPQKRGAGLRTFTMYRRGDLSASHSPDQANAPDEPQFEGVVFTDGSAALRWLTAKRSTSVWASFEDAMAIHGHPEYDSELVWHGSSAGSLSDTRTGDAEAVRAALVWAITPGHERLTGAMEALARLVARCAE